MENIYRVTNHIRNSKSRAASSDRFTADSSRSTLTIIPARDNRLWGRDKEGGWWRTYLYIEGCHSLELSTSRNDARVLGESIAHFQKELSDLGLPRLHETIPAFHDMVRRYKSFHESLLKDDHNRAKDVKREIDFFIKNEDRGAILVQSIQEGTIPERICHNDCKINNILLDDESGEALCVIDLDTVMPGTPLFDFGDLVRTVCTSAAEDEKDLYKVKFDPDYFKALLTGYLSEAIEFLLPPELDLLCEAGRNLTQIMGLRFLTDYLDGDRYYHISRPDHNLDRCRNQIALIKSLDLQWEAGQLIVKKLCRERT